MALAWPLCFEAGRFWEREREQHVAHGLVVQHAVDEARDWLPTKHPSGGMFYCLFILFVLFVGSKSTWEHVAGQFLFIESS